MRKTNKKGFTIVELVIVIAVIAILAAVMIPTFAGVVDDAKEAAALQDVKSAYSATIAKDLEDETNVVYGHTTDIIVDVEGIKISISTNGEATVVTSGTATATHTLANGLLTAVAGG